jgi:hypothetical protein
MIGSDPLGPDGLNDLQQEGLKMREQLDRKFFDSFNEN